MGDAIITRCKFYCESVSKRWSAYEKRFIYGYIFLPVTEGSAENKAFFAYTPSGKFEVGTALVDKFEPGKEYYLDITEAITPVEVARMAEPAPAA